ncbi:MAG: arginine--tRNA ligase [Acidobacteriota bacterium]
MLTAAVVKNILSDAIRKKFRLEIDAAIEYPPRPDFGDMATPVAFEIARTLKKAPRLIAEEIAATLEKPPEIDRVQIAGGGYINIFFNRTEFTKSLFASTAAPETDESRGSVKIVVEHTNINPNKAAHIGHLRNAVLGDTLSRVLRHLGYCVEVQNYIDDTGVQVADLVVGFQHLLNYDLEKIMTINGKFDYFCWDLYSRVTAYYEENPDKIELRERALKAIEEGNNETARLASYLANRIVHHHLATMERIGVIYDLLVWESHVISMKFWEKALQLLKEKKAIYFCEEGKNSGCWVMNFPVFSDSEMVDESEKIIVRSNGTATYVGKDIAYQLWKFGLLGKDFLYRKWRSYDAERAIWSTSPKFIEASHPGFGKADQVVNVIDVRQSYLQRIVKEGLMLLGFTKEGENSVHFSYEMVALSPRCALEMGFEVSEEDKARPYIEMSGRKGQGVKADDLLDKLLEGALREVKSRNPDMGQEAIENIARNVASGALRYFMLKFTRNKVISFDFANALNFDGETGPYIQYSAVRARNIFNKMKERESFHEKEIERMADQISFESLDPAGSQDHWEIVIFISKMDEILECSTNTLELSAVAKYCFMLAQKFNSFYQKYPVMKEKDPAIKKLRIIITHLFIIRLTKALELMGIAVPSRM